MGNYIPISLEQVALAALLMLVDIVLSLWLRLGLERRLIVASVRMTAQLLLVGFILTWIFRLSAPGPILLVGSVMASIAGITAVQRTSRRFPGIFWDSLVSVFGAAFVVTGVALAGIIRVRPWYEAQYFIPVLGMVLGNMLNGVSLALDRYLDGLTTGRDGIEMLLALGATSWEASHRALRDGLRVGMVPTVNSMMVMGVVSLPGMMTGQILAGAKPSDAVRYQIVIMFVISSATALAAIGVLLLAFRTLFSPDHQLRSNLLTRAKE
jgi:putative ABC transport system permease protein